MKKNGFTLIELLAVITIMGILMLVAIPAISRTIENARKDTFIDTVKKYEEAARTMWASDNLICDGFTSSAVQAGVYYIEVDSSSSSVPQLLEKGGKSPWGNRDIKGFICIMTWIEGAGTASETRKVTFHPSLSDGIHGVNVKKPSEGVGTASKWIRGDKMVRGDVVMTGAAYSIYGTESASGELIFNVPRFTFDLNDDGDKDDTIDGIYEGSQPAVKCVEN